MSKKRIIAIITIIVLLFAAGISVGVFLYSRGEAEAANGTQVGESTDNTVTNQEDDDETSTTPGSENENVAGTENNENSDEEVNGTENNETVENDNENANNETTNNNVVEDTNNETNQGNNAGVTTGANVDNVGETTITRVEEKERLVSKDYLDWWQPMQVAINPTVLGVNRTQITVEKSAITGFGENKVVYVGENITYVIKVTNNSKTELKNIEITDKIPQNTTFTSIEDATIDEKIEGTKTTVTSENKIVGVKWKITIPAGKTAIAKFTVNVNKTMLNENGEEVETTGTILNTAMANGQQSNETQTTIAKPNQSKVEINVPGEDGEKQHDEIILMVDGSYSGDDEWPEMKEAIIEIGKAVLNGEGNTQLTLMAFGMGDNEVLTHVKTVTELEKSLGELPGTLLYGRSSTNCEAGFTGVEEYINNHDESLNEVYVIYISDGEINTDETPYAFYNWKENSWLKRNKETIAKWSIQSECEYILYGLVNPSEAFKTIFGEKANPEIVATTVTDEQALAWADLVWDAVYASAELNPEEAYSVSDAERAFVTYDKQNNTHIEEAFYYALWGRTYPERWNRTPAAGNALAANEKVKKLYMVDSNSYTSWMDTGITAENSEFIQSNGISGLITALEGVITDLSKTSFNDVVVTNYTSKWVNLDQASISIVDNTTNTTIYTTEQGWLIEKEQRPTTQETPVKIEVVPASEYNNGGEAVEGNTHGDIYKITWYVKDGALLRSDSYRLEYNMTEDYSEEGFEYGMSYPTSGNTFIEYKDENGNDKKEELAQ